MRNANCLHCPCQAYAGYFFVARALLINETSEMEEFTGSIRQFCETHWTLVSSAIVTEEAGLKQGPASYHEPCLASWCNSIYYDIMTRLMRH